MIKDELSGLSLLLAVADKRSFTAAAAALGVTPSAVSQAISALEARLGARLLHRTTRSVGLTEEGARLLERLRPALAEVRASFEVLDQARGRPAGLLRLNLPRLTCRALIEPVLSAFLAAYPEIRLELALEDRFADIVARGFDAGIRLGEMLDREMIAVRLGGPDRLAVVGSPGYFAKHGKPRHPRDLHGHDCIRFRGLSDGALLKWEFTEKGKDFEIAVDGRLICNDAGLMVRAARDGVGLVSVLESVVRGELASKRLVRVLDAFCPPFPGYFLYYPSRAHLPPRLQALIAFLKKPASGRDFANRPTDRIHRA